MATPLNGVESEVLISLFVAQDIVALSLKTAFNHIYFMWAILAVPLVGMFVGQINAVDIHTLIHLTGEFAARFMIIAMMLTPLLMLFPKSRILKWLIQRRRAIGVAAFCYAVVHTLLYLIDNGSLASILYQARQLGIGTGWLAFAIFIPLALTSNQTMVVKLRSMWKPLQRWVYVAAVFTLLHWIFVHNNIGPALVHFIPLALLESYRVYRIYTRRSQVTA